MKFKRESDPYSYTILRWGTSIILHIGLFYYAFIKVKDVVSRESFTQSTARSLPWEERFKLFPLIRVCTTDSEVRLKDEDTARNVTMQAFEVSGPNSHCYKKGTTETVLSTANANTTVTGYTDEDSVYATFSSKTKRAPGNISMEMSFVEFIPYADGGGNRYNGNNIYEHYQDREGLVFHVVPMTRRTVREDSWGLFGILKVPSEELISSSLSNIDARTNDSYIEVLLPTEHKTETEIL
ncbi:hypothetical protein BGZ65_012424 [Modicella reniformis]|uniref:Uncharacterized protein n=1 Tax=Modicella reniformis TaxID=1440133 RepID=A0A9P6IM77_9FUNG|nr:hypothetical protein BGZ65_012424 [Modicella reniformis]